MDIFLMFTVGALVIFGLLMVYSSSFVYALERTGDGFSLIRKQALFAVLGFGALFVALRIPYRKWSDWGYWVLLLAIAALILTATPGVGTRVGGAQRWLRIGDFAIQPGEFAKFAVIVFVARQLAKKFDRLTRFVPGVLAQLVVPLPILLLLLFQPDFGTTVMIIGVVLLLMFLAGVPKRYLAICLLAGGTLGTWLALGTPYRRNRVMGFLDPWSDPGGSGFQILQSMVGLHQGRLWGVGLGNGKEKLLYLPEAHNDFIFAVIGEELGFLGVIAVAAAFLYLIYRGLLISWNAYRNYQDRFGMLLAAGITMALGLQAFVNMAVVLGLVPTKGLTLPFISYGGSALIVDLFAVGVLLNIARGPAPQKAEL